MCVFCSLTGQNFPYNLSIARQWVAVIPVKTYYDHVRLDLLSLVQITRVLTIYPWNLRKVQRWNKKRFGLILGVRKCWTHGWRKTKKAETSTIEAREARKKKRCETKKKLYPRFDPRSLSQSLLFMGPRKEIQYSINPALIYGFILVSVCLFVCLIVLNFTNWKLLLLLG